MTKKKSRRTKKLKVELVSAEGLSEEEIERRWDEIFDIIFDELLKRPNSERVGTHHTGQASSFYSS